MAAKRRVGLMEESSGWVIAQGSADKPEKSTKWRLDAAGTSLTQVVTQPQMTPWQKAKTFPLRVMASIVAYLLPHGYPDTVAPSYTAYAAWTGFGMLFSSISGVLSMQSLLYAVGLGAGAVPIAAALNWILKDGLGQLGGVVSAAFINNRFDTDPKKWRFRAALLQDASCLLEVLTAIVPQMFLPLASIANVGKNISWLAASATRANLHQTMAIRGNLADVTGKAGSQTIAASTAGTIAGVVLTPLVGSDPSHIFLAFAICAVLHQLCIHHGLRRIVLPTVNGPRLQLAAAGVLRHAGDAEAARTASLPATPAAPTFTAAAGVGSVAPVAQDGAAASPAGAGAASGGVATEAEHAAPATIAAAMVDVTPPSAGAVSSPSTTPVGAATPPSAAAASGAAAHRLFSGALRVLTPDEVASREGFAPWARHGRAAVGPDGATGTGIAGAATAALRRARSWVSERVGSRGSQQHGFYTSLSSSSSSSSPVTSGGLPAGSPSGTDDGASVGGTGPSSSMPVPAAAGRRAANCWRPSVSDRLRTVDVVVGPPLSQVSHFMDFYTVSHAATSKYVVAIQRPALQEQQRQLAAAQASQHASLSSGATVKPVAASGASALAPPAGWWQSLVRRCWPASTKPRVQLLLLDDAAWRDTITGYLHAAFVAGQLEAAPPPPPAADAAGAASPATALDAVTQLHADLELIVRGGLFTAEYGDAVLQDLEAAGWWVGQPLLERDSARRVTVRPAEAAQVPVAVV